MKYTAGGNTPRSLDPTLTRKRGTLSHPGSLLIAAVALIFFAYMFGFLPQLDTYIGLTPTVQLQLLAAGTLDGDSQNQQIVLGPSINVSLAPFLMPRVTTLNHSRNNFLFGILGLGEGWHNNHHAFPFSARHGLKWWQLDMSYYIIWLLSFFGLVHLFIRSFVLCTTCELMNY